MKGFNVILIIAILLIPIAFADTLIGSVSFCSASNRSYFNKTTGSDFIIYNDDNTCGFRFQNGARYVSNVSHFKFPDTANSTWYCKVNMSISATGGSGRGMSMMNGSEGTLSADWGSFWTDAVFAMGNSCTPTTGRPCVLMNTVESPLIVGNDNKHYLYNVTWNGTNLSWNNVLPTYHQNFSLVLPNNKINYYKHWVFGEPLDSPTFDYINLTRFECWNVTPSVFVPDTTPPEITYYNVTGNGGCVSWNTDKNTACSTSFVTPTVQFNTDKAAYCAISGNFSSTSGMNYSDMGSSRNCTGAASGEGSTSHLCTLTSQDELVYETSYLYISCKDTSGNQNRTSTSGALALSITGLEDAGRTFIGIGIQNALLSDYTNYTNQQIYSRNLLNGQVGGTFDRAVKKGTKTWAFNRIGVSDSHVNMFNLTPVLYTLELANKTSSQIINQVELLINTTKV